jgi:hypothetical protein
MQQTSLSSSWDALMRYTSYYSDSQEQPKEADSFQELNFRHNLMGV